MPTPAAHRQSQRAEAGPRVSMRDVAQQAGLSRSAVSLALQGHPSIPRATRERVQAAASHLGYRKNPLVAALMRSRRRSEGTAVPQLPLAFLTSDRSPDSWRQSATHRRFHASAATRAAELGFRLDEFSVGDPDLRPERVRVLLQARGIQGLLIAPLPGEQTRLDFDVTDFAAVGLGMSVREPGIDRVADDHFHGAREAFAQTLALGYRRIGLAVAASISRRLDNRWWAGFLVAQQELPERLRFPALMPETRDDLPEQLGAWIRRHRLDAVIFTLRDPDLMNVAPSEVGLVSLSVPDATGRVAGIRQDEQRVGSEAIDLLAARLQQWTTGPSDSPRLTLIPGVWCPGLSAPGAGRRRRALI